MAPNAASQQALHCVLRVAQMTGAMMVECDAASEVASEVMPAWAEPAATPECDELALFQQAVKRDLGSLVEAHGTPAKIIQHLLPTINLKLSYGSWLLSTFPEQDDFFYASKLADFTQHGSLEETADAAAQSVTSPK